MWSSLTGWCSDCAWVSLHSSFCLLRSARSNSASCTPRTSAIWRRRGVQRSMISRISGWIKCETSKRGCLSGRFSRFVAALSLTSVCWFWVHRCFEDRCFTNSCDSKVTVCFCACVLCSVWVLFSTKLLVMCHVPCIELNSIFLLNLQNCYFVIIGNIQHLWF